MTKEELSKRIGELYGVDMRRGVYAGYDGKYGVIEKDVWLIDDTARMFELAVENGISFENGLMVVARVDKIFVVESLANHPTKLEATLYAIGLALVKKAEVVK